MKKNKIYFASDFHLGSPNIKQSHKREKLIVKWLHEISKDAKAIYLIGDIFDFWYEYKYVVPKGSVRLLGTLANLIDNGIEIHFLKGNHDLWMKEYLNKEIGIIIHEKSIVINEQEKKIFLAHGDGFGEGDIFYKFLKKIFISKFCQWVFTRLHPNLSFKIAHAWSKKSRNKEKAVLNKKHLLEYCQKHQKITPVDYYIFGHIHHPLHIDVDQNSTYINTGDWIKYYTYAVLNNKKITLEKYQKI